MNVEINSIPASTGVYIFRDKAKKALYVGKAINIKNRVSSYFANPDLLDPKTRVLVSKINKIEHIVVKNEIEALLLESELIKRDKPLYNISLKDDKFYKYIVIGFSKLSVNEQNQTVYKIGTSRRQKTDRAVYFGPFPEASSIKIVLKILRKVFPYRDCSQIKFNRYKKAKKPCLYGHIGLCPAPCQGLNQIKANNQNVKKIRKYLAGDTKTLFKKMENEMKNEAKKENFEKAAYLRDQIASYNYLTQEIGSIREYIEVPQVIKFNNMEGVNELIKILNEEAGFEFDGNRCAAGFRIEVFDISNIQGTNAVGSMVVLTRGMPDRKEYRRFKIRGRNTPNDFAMVREVLKRRFSHRKDQVKWLDPNLIVIDGGKGQLSSALEALESSGVKIPTIGLAKRNEEIVISVKGEFKIIKLGASSLALKILKEGRDEAHRFGITYYRRLHRQKLYEAS